MHLRAFFCLFLILLSTLLHAKSLAICTSGRDRDSTTDDWRSENIDDVCTKLARLGIDDCTKPNSKTTLRGALARAVDSLSCGDTLVLYFNGHGTDDKGFVFDREDHDSDDRYVTPAEILEWLSDLDCCVDIYVGWHACYSGKFIAELSEDPHVKLAISSASESKTAHKGKVSREGLPQYIHSLNWPDGFALGLTGPGSLAEIFQKAAKLAKERAEETDRLKRRAYEDDPQDFKRGHIETVRRVRGGVLVTLKVGSGTVVVHVPDDAKIGYNGITFDELQPCMDITCSGEATFDEDDHFTVEDLEIEEFSAKFHVLEVTDRRRNKVKVRYTAPRGLRNEEGTVVINPLPAGIAFCSWYTTRGTVSGQILTSIPDSLKASTPEPYSWEGHVVSIDRAANEYEVVISKPRSLARQRLKVKAKPGETLPPWLDVCVNSIFEGAPAVGQITLEGAIDVEVENIAAHVDEVDAATGDITITIGRIPARHTGSVRVLKAAPGENTAALTPCNNIFFRGKIRKDDVVEASSINVVN